MDWFFTIVIPIYSLTAIILGVWLGHKLTMTAFSHVQPSTKEMAKMGEGTVTNEPDWVDEAYKEPVPEMDTAEEDVLRKAFEKTGLPDEVWDSYKKNGRSPQEFFGYDVPYNKQGVEEEIEKEKA